MSFHDALEELDNYADDVALASYQTATNAIQRYVARLDTEPLLSYSQQVLPVVDFDEWYENTQSTIGSMVGSGRLDWPIITTERVALQAELMRRIASGQIDLIEFTYNFHYVENRFDTNIAAFVNQTFRPFHRDLLRLARPLLEEEQRATSTNSQKTFQVEYISQTRLNELQTLKSNAFDFRKLIRICEELDLCFRNQCYLAVATLTRALLDHVPPIFGCNSFTEVANNYAGAKSFRDSMLHLENSARKIGDAHLHIRIRNKETLPTSTQVNFSNDIDVLLAEIVRICS